jgi:polysaccharide biosynthesis protein PelG
MDTVGDRGCGNIGTGLIMAGIGFALQRLSNEDNLLSRAASMGHAAVIAAGPWIFTILSLGIITLTTEPLAGLQTLETFRCAVISAFAISLVTTSPVAIITTRLVADGLYQRKFESIAGVYIGSLSAATIPVALAIVLIYAGILKIPLPLGVAGSACCLLVALIWISLALAGTVHDYVGVTFSFIFGLLVSVAGSLSAAILDLGAVGLIWGFNIGLAVTLFCLMARVLTTFPHEVRDPISGIRDLWRAVKRYWVIALGSLAANAAIWVDKWVMWVSETGETVKGGFVHAPLYDSAMFVACLVIIPALSLFVVHLETDFFDSYQRYFANVRQHATLRRIEESRKQLVEVAMGSLFHILLIQVALCGVMVLIAPVIADLINLQYRQIAILRYGAMSALFQFLFLASSAILLFFDQRKRYLALQLLFLVLNAGLTYISIKLGWRFHGVGFFLAAVISSLVAFAVMERTLVNLNYLTFIGNNPSVRGD